MRKTLLAIAASLMLMTSATASWAMQVDVIVNKSTQRMRVLVDGVQKYEWLVSTGGQGYDTLSGNFKIFRKEAEHFSKEWDNAPMPHAMFFTGLGHAIHGSFHTKRLGTRASHGCVRLAPENAAVLFDLVEKAGFQNNTVKISGGFFDNSKLTTADTFKMTPRTKEDAIAAAAKPKSIFSFGKKVAPQKIAEIKKPVAVNSIFTWASAKKVEKAKLAAIKAKAAKSAVKLAETKTAKKIKKVKKPA